MHVLHDFGANDLVEDFIRERELKGVALDHGSHRIEFRRAALQGAGRPLESGAIEVEAHDVCTSLEGAEAVASLATARVEEPLAAVNLELFEVNRE